MDIDAQGRFQRPEFDHVWDVYKHVADFEHHFNTLQSEYRTLASTWLLAMFGAIGYVLANPSNWPVDRFFIIAVVAIFATVGLFILWLLDLLVYQKLLHSAFVEGTQLELDYPWLPQIRSRMKRAMPNWRATNRTVWYYVTTTSAALAIATISLTIGTYEVLSDSGPEANKSASSFAVAVACAVAIVSLLVAVAIERKMMRASGATDPPEGSAQGGR